MLLFRSLSADLKSQTLSMFLQIIKQSSRYTFQFLLRKDKMASHIFEVIFHVGRTQNSPLSGSQ